ncbi:hypothetical protein ACH4E7_33950 [Kitasatospora sp. NPDC018058]|uniref:hypothetical protein n=1 Tax=Kitasatospora sp. NPDC018058 TaxID=3364025 RepID=UPI0037C02E46
MPDRRGRSALLGHVAHPESVDYAFLAAVDADPVAAYEEFSRQSLLLDARIGEAAADARDEARWPGLTNSERELRRAEETLMRPELPVPRRPGDPGCRGPGRECARSRVHHHDPDRIRGRARP